MAVAPREDIYGISSSEKGEGAPAAFTTNSSGQEPKIYTAADAQKEAPPPSYESLFGRVKKIRVESKSTKEFCVKCTRATCETAILQIFLGFVVCVSIANIVIGALYYNDCSENPGVPRFLVFHGSGLLILLVIFLSEYIVMKKKGRTRADQDKHTPGIINVLRYALIMYLIVYFIIGCIVSINAFNSDEDCSEVLRIYAFTFCVTFLSLLGLLILFCICGGIVDGISRKKKQTS